MNNKLFKTLRAGLGNGLKCHAREEIEKMRDSSKQPGPSEVEVRKVFSESITKNIGSAVPDKWLKDIYGNSIRPGGVNDQHAKEYAKRNNCSIVVRTEITIVDENSI